MGIGLARAKPKWRKVLNARFLRWWVLGHLVRLVPALGRAFAFFPTAVDMIQGADQVLLDKVAPIPSKDLAQHMKFLQLCAPHDSRAPGTELPEGAVTGQRTALYDQPWVDCANGSVLLPKTAQTVLVRGQVANWNATSVRMYRSRLRVQGRAFAPLVTQNYFHVLLENGVRALDLLDSGVLDEAPLTILLPEPQSAVATTMWQGIAALQGHVRLQTVPAGALALPDQAVVHFPPDTYWEWPPVSRSSVDRLGAAFDAVYGEDAKADGSQHLYLSRDGAKLRDPLNAAELGQALTGAGFQTFVATDQNHAQQIASFRAARTVVAVHGAGLTNLVFCKPGTRVIEIFPKNFVKSTYWRLAQQLDLDYRPVIGGPGDYDQRFDVDVPSVLQALEVS